MAYGHLEREERKALIGLVPLILLVSMAMPDTKLALKHLWS